MAKTSKSDDNKMDSLDNLGGIGANVSEMFEYEGPDSFTLAQNKHKAKKKRPATDNNMSHYIQPMQNFNPSSQALASLRCDHQALQKKHASLKRKYKTSKEDVHLLDKRIACLETEVKMMQQFTGINTLPLQHQLYGLSAPAAPSQQPMFKSPAFHSPLPPATPSFMAHPPTPTIPLREEDYPDVQYWHKHTWTKEHSRKKNSGDTKGSRGRSHSAQGINVTALYLEDQDGTAVSGFVV
ncbi:hypothetical protein DXG01_010990 [Tephrocybe rancida]|nr:hypothetical protein DXG01_010990 [Tephrocybe rancida]